MLREVLFAFLKFVGAILVLVVVWLAAGEFQRRSFKQEFDEAIRIRVRQECVRPESIRTLAQAKQYDLTVQELDLLTQQLQFLTRRTSVLLDHAEQLETLRAGMVQGKLPPVLGGIGGPAPERKNR
jgi:hypothetical protein